jgi:hypothetical protein
MNKDIFDQQNRVIESQRQQIQKLRDIINAQEKHECPGTLVEIEFNTRKLPLCRQCAIELVHCAVNVQLN